MKIHKIIARDLPDLWFQAVYDILDNGRRFTIIGAHMPDRHGWSMTIFADMLNIRGTNHYCRIYLLVVVFPIR